MPELQGFYNSTSWQDDMAWAAAWLAWRTSNASMLEEGRQWYAEIPVKLARGPWYSWDTGETLVLRVTRKPPARFEAGRPAAPPARPPAPAS